MPVLSILIPKQDESRLAIAACKYGVPAEVIDRDGDSVYVDLFGTTEKMTATANEVRHEVLAEVPKVYDRSA